MRNLQFVKDYRQKEQLRTSFFALASDTFGLELDRWYQEGFWDGRYIPFSYAAGGQIVVNVSVNLLDLVIDGSTVQAVQLGTVMTHPGYRRQEGDQLHLFDIIGRRAPDIHSILSKLTDSSTIQIVFHYTPDYSGLDISNAPYDSGLFVKAGSGFSFAGNMKHPATSIA